MLTILRIRITTDVNEGTIGIYELYLFYSFPICQMSSGLTPESLQRFKLLSRSMYFISSSTTDWFCFEFIHRSKKGTKAYFPTHYALEIKKISLLSNSKFDSLSSGYNWLVNILCRVKLLCIKYLICIIQFHKQYGT